MKLNVQKTIKISAVIASLAGVVMGMGFGCGIGWQPSGTITELSSFSVIGDVGDNSGLSIVAGSKTVAVTNFTAALDNMTSMTNVAPSTQTLTIFNDKLGSFSETGSALTINAPMLMAYVSVGAEACDDLLDQEAAAAVANRRFLGNLNLAANANLTTLNVDANNDQILDPVASMARRFARQFWQRNESAEELAIINDGVKEMRDAAAANAQGLPRRAALFACTAMIASTSGYEL